MDVAEIIESGNIVKQCLVIYLYIIRMYNQHRGAMKCDKRNVIRAPSHSAPVFQVTLNGIFGVHCAQCIVHSRYFDDSNIDFFAAFEAKLEHPDLSTK